MHFTRLLYGKAVPVAPSRFFSVFLFLSCSSGTITVGIKKVLSFRIEVVEMSISTLTDLLNMVTRCSRVNNRESIAQDRHKSNSNFLKTEANIAKSLDTQGGQHNLKLSKPVSVLCNGKTWVVTKLHQLNGTLLIVAQTRALDIRGTELCQRHLAI
jgi:hypothetical protein